jgi:hypothetical protein
MAAELEEPAGGQSRDGVVGAQADADSGEVPRVRQRRKPISEYAMRVAGRIQRLNDALFGWPIPSLVLVLVAFLGSRPSRWDYLLLALPVSLLLVHAFAGYRDTEFGPRYAYEACGALMLLSARGLGRIEEVTARFAGDVADLQVRRGVVGVIVFACLTAFAFTWVPRFQFYGSPHWVWSAEPEAAIAVDAADLHDALVFVSKGPDRGDRPFEAVFLRNGLDLDGADVLFALDLGDRNRELVEYYPDRKPYLFRDGELRPLE